jgi:TolA-binding protein
MSWRALIPMSLGGCPPSWQLTRAFLEKENEENRAVAAHAERCPRCAAEWADLARVDAAAHMLPVPRMTEAAREALKSRLLEIGAVIPAAPLPAEGHRRAGAVVALAVASGVAAAAVLSLARPRPRGADGPPASLASIRAVGATSFARLQPPPDELVRLDTGTLQITVGRVGDGRRFRVATDDAVIDASEGRLRVEASAHMLVAVRVFAGYADVKAKGERAALRAGDEWTREPSDAIASHEEPAAAPSPPRAPVTSRTHEAASPPAPHALPSLAQGARTTPRSSTVASLVPAPPAAPGPHAGGSVAQRATFERAWTLLRSGDAAAAAAAFAQVDALAGDDAIAEDALFWQSVALARAQRKGEAEGTLRTFVSRYPSSARLGEASAMLGWMLLDEGDADGARRAFERAEHDRVDRVRASARSGLERLEAAATASDR